MFVVDSNSFSSKEIHEQKMGGTVIGGSPSWRDKMRRLLQEDMDDLRSTQEKDNHSRSELDLHDDDSVVLSLNMAVNVIYIYIYILAPVPAIISVLVYVSISLLPH